jgi:hypothetical protein
LKFWTAAASEARRRFGKEAITRVAPKKPRSTEAEMQNKIATVKRDGLQNPLANIW